jgi:hypothetical protein
MEKILKLSLLLFPPTDSTCGILILAMLNALSVGLCLLGGKMADDRLVLLNRLLSNSYSLYRGKYTAY